MEGFEDPFNRRTFPWGREDPELLDWFTRLGHLRQESAALRRGDIRYRASDGPLLAFTRTCGEETVLAALNAGDQAAVLRLEDGERVQPLLGAARLQTAPPGAGPDTSAPDRESAAPADGLEEDQAYAD